MKNVDLKRYQNIGFILLTALLIITALITLTIHLNKDITNANFLITWAISHHVGILFALIVISVSCGFLWSNLSYREIKKTKKEKKSLLATVFLFLSNEEKEIINSLVQNKGTISQSDVSRLPGMNRVKAHRSLKKMQDNNLITITAHGKVRYINLKKEVLDSLLDET